jgi:hypothetical protein
MAGGLSSAPEGIRTPDLRFRRPTLYPAELRARGAAPRLHWVWAGIGIPVHSTLADLNVRGLRHQNRVITQRLAIVSPEGSAPRRVLELTAVYRHAPLAEDAEAAVKLIRSTAQP